MTTTIERRPATRLFVSGGLAAGRPLALSPGQAHYLRSVLRLAPGAEVAAFNGRDGEWRGRLTALAKGRAELEPLRQVRPQAPEPDLWLCFAPVKQARIDLIAEKAAELGAACLLPVLTRRTDVARVNVDRLRANAVEAAEQCGRLSVPEVAEPVALARLLRDWPPTRPLLVCTEAGPARPLAAVAAELEGGLEGGAAGFLVGPEGGFEAAELDALADLPFCHLVGLGPRILRAETAVVAALACWQAVVGDWSARPPGRSS